ncbi:succinate--CoA ligase [GDP-forming] subunit beta, mitochondrial isoform X2 [Bemisia tabaci]
MQIRKLNLLECHCKDLLRNHNVNVQNYRIIEKVEDSKKLLDDFKVDEYVIKAQVLAGGRGKGHFSNGFKGGVHITEDVNTVPEIINNMLGHRLITKQTSQSGVLVSKVMVAESVSIVRETYFCILLDRNHNGPVIIASPEGGMDIETVAEETPHLLKTVPVDINVGLTNSMANEIAEFLLFKGDMKSKVVNQIKNLYDMFVKLDAVQIEINPLVETDKNNVIAVDAKIQLDDNAEFRQREVFKLDDISESNPLEVRAAQHNLNYVSMDGSIGCLVNGAGLAMATMDIIKLHGGEPANFLDVGGGVTENQVLNAFSILTSDSKVRSILVNVFGGIVNCRTIAAGVIGAAKEMGLNIPLIVRLEGTNVQEGKQLLESSGLPIQFADNLDQAALKAVSSA